MCKGIIGRKLGMTNVFAPDGRVVPVTVVQAGPCVVTQVKQEATDGYNALQLGFGQRSAKRISQPVKGHLAKSGAPTPQVLREVAVANPADYAPGQTIGADLFQVGERVDVGVLQDVTEHRQRAVPRRAVGTVGDRDEIRSDGRETVDRAAEGQRCGIRSRRKQLEGERRTGRIGRLRGGSVLCEHRLGLSVEEQRYVTMVCRAANLGASRADTGLGARSMPVGATIWSNPSKR